MAKTKLHPLGDRIAVSILTEKKTASGIIIPDTASKERPEQGIVVAAGPGRFADDGKRIPMQVKVGDTVVFSKYGPDEVKIDGSSYYILREEQVLAVIK